MERGNERARNSCPPALGTGQSRIARILIVDNHPIVREGLRSIIEEARDLVICAEADSATNALAAIRETEPDVIVTDISLNRGEGIGLMREVRSCYPNLAILVLSNQQEDVFAEHMLSLGANGYITKNATSEQILCALRRVIDGGTCVSDSVARNIIRGVSARGRPFSANPVDRLSNRELQVLHGIRNGMSTREIARSLNLSIKTVESHRERIKRKLNLRNGIHLMRFAVDWFNCEYTGEMPKSGAHEISDAPRAAECI